MKILLVCAAGASTSLVTNRMKAALKPEQQGWTIDAKSVEQLEEVITGYDVVLMGPQIAYKRKEVEKVAASYGKPVDVIGHVDYGMGKGENILNQAIRLVEGNH